MSEQRQSLRIASFERVELAFDCNRLVVPGKENARIVVRHHAEILDRFCRPILLQQSPAILVSKIGLVERRVDRQREQPFVFLDRLWIIDGFGIGPKLAEGGFSVVQRELSMGELGGIVFVLLRKIEKRGGGFGKAIELLQ